MEVLEITGPTLITAAGQPPLAVFPSTPSHATYHGFCEALTQQEGYQHPRANFGAGWNDNWWFGDQPIPPHPLWYYRLWNRVKAARAFVHDRTREWLRVRKLIRG